MIEIEIIEINALQVRVQMQVHSEGESFEVTDGRTYARASVPGTRGVCGKLGVAASTVTYRLKRPAHTCTSCSTDASGVWTHALQPRAYACIKKGTRKKGNSVCKSPHRAQQRRA